MKPPSIALAVLMFAGCYSSVGPFPGRPKDGSAAVYWHPQTNDLRHCVNHTAQAIFLGGAIGGISAGNAYAECKTNLEREGYAREEWTAPAETASTKDFCRRRANATYGGRAQWEADYWRCMAGH